MTEKPKPNGAAWVGAMILLAVVLFGEKKHGGNGDRPVQSPFQQPQHPTQPQRLRNHQGTGLPAPWTRFKKNTSPRTTSTAVSSPAIPTPTGTVVKDSK